MGDMHLTRELLLAVMAGAVPPSVVAQVGLDHLMNLCPHCRAEVTAFLQERPTASKTAHVPSLDAVSAVLDRHPCVPFLPRHLKRTETSGGLPIGAPDLRRAPQEAAA